MPSTLNLYGIRIYNCEVESILAFIALTRENWLTVFKLLAESQMEVQYCKPLRWQLPVWNKLLLYVSFIIRSSVVVFLYAKHYICHRFQRDSWSMSPFLDVLPEERFLDLGSSRDCARFHIMSVCLSWPHITSPDWARGGHLLSSHSSKHCRS